MFIYLKLGRCFILLVSKQYNCGYGECRGFQLWQSCVVFLDETLYSHQASLYPGVLINVYRRLLWYLTKCLRKGEGLLWTSLLFRESCNTLNYFMWKPWWSTHTLDHISGVLSLILHFLSLLWIKTKQVKWSLSYTLQLLSPETFFINKRGWTK